MPEEKSEEKRVPLLYDHHNHFSLYALFNSCLNLQDERDKREALKQLRACDRDKVSVVLGWNSSYYGFSEEELQSLPPLIIVNISLHEFIMTPSAVEMLKEDYPEITAHYHDPEWYERNFPRMMIFLGGLVEPAPEKFAGFLDVLHKKGIWRSDDMLLISEKVFKMVRAQPFADRVETWADLETFKTLGADVQAQLKGVKLFTDGALGSRTAALSGGYLDGGFGFLLHSDEELYRLMREASGFGKPLSVHAIGDLATGQVVRTVAKIAGDGIAFPSIRMEHCQLVSLENAREAKRLGIILSMQPNFSTDSINYSDRLPQEYLESNNPFRMLIDEAGFVPGEDLIFGSDGMPHGVDAALEASLTPPVPGQKLTLKEFTAGYCI